MYSRTLSLFGRSVFHKAGRTRRETRERGEEIKKKGGGGGEVEEIEREEEIKAISSLSTRLPPAITLGFYQRYSSLFFSIFSLTPSLYVVFSPSLSHCYYTILSFFLGLTFLSSLGVFLFTIILPLLAYPLCNDFTINNFVSLFLFYNFYFSLSLLSSIFLAIDLKLISFF